MENIIKDQTSPNVHLTSYAMVGVAIKDGLK